MKSKYEFQKVLGSNLRRIRNNSNWSIEKLALESGLTYSQIGRIELGKRNPSCFTIYLISKTLNVGLAELFSNDMEPVTIQTGEYSENPKE
jgi:transcriptional regulator with XRE-family HTH domain